MFEYFKQAYLSERWKGFRGHLPIRKLGPHSSILHSLLVACKKTFQHIVYEIKNPRRKRMEEEERSLFNAPLPPRFVEGKRMIKDAVRVEIYSKAKMTYQEADQILKESRRL